MKNERATAQFHAARVFRAMTGALFRLMDIHRAQLERIPLTFEHSPRGERSFCILVG